MSTHRFDLFAPEARANPHPIYAEMRRNSPVCQVDPGGIWAVARYDDVLFVLKHPEIFSSQGFRVTLLAPWLESNPLADSLLVLDPPEHNRLRALVSRGFTPGMIAGFEPRVRAIAEELAGELERLGEADFMASFAVPLPARVICELLGLDPTLHAEFKRWADHLAMVSPVTPSEHIPAVRATVEAMIGFMKEVIARRRKTPANDVVTRLLRAEIDGHALSEAEIVGFMSIILMAGFETTTNLLTKTVLGLTGRPADIARLRADPALLAGFTEEALRFESPAEIVLRQTTTEVTLSGVTIPKGAFVAAIIASAQRDERKFPEPDRFDMARKPDVFIAFGHGPHHCLGAPLARLEMKVGLETLLRRFERFERLPGELAWNCTLAVRCPHALPLRFVVPASSSVRSARYVEAAV
ncbi:cytochrome P450 [Sorangium cellulosum]|uniref:Cytochrome P450 n=1 Tax=Sorangium cellulosum TaxID=56 RepID=A0A2L0ES81_SORCE|nr:cytochrome P450 [Sorangium cellulosum]AUX42149.1 cytochrome P450 [Sorangium cellulosum]